MRIAVIGAGLFGSIIWEALKQEGHEVVLIDDGKERAGSDPAACLMKPSWFSSLGKDVYEPSLALLDKLYGVEDITFKLPVGSAKVHWCDPSRILARHVAHKDHVLNAGRLLGTYDRVIVAAGIWCRDIIPTVGIDQDLCRLVPRVGAAFLWYGATTEPRIKPWAPYRQLVKFNRGDGVWVGDGTALKPESFTPARLRTSLERCAHFAGLDPDAATVMVGSRPYIPKLKPCYLKEVIPNLWVVTGGAKNGTLAAGWCAHKLVEEFKE